MTTRLHTRYRYSKELSVRQCGVQLTTIGVVHQHGRGSEFACSRLRVTQEFQGISHFEIHVHSILCKALDCDRPAVDKKNKGNLLNWKKYIRQRQFKK